MLFLKSLTAILPSRLPPVSVCFDVIASECARFFYPQEPLACGSRTNVTFGKHGVPFWSVFCWSSAVPRCAGGYISGEPMLHVAKAEGREEGALQYILLVTLHRQHYGDFRPWGQRAPWARRCLQQISSDTCGASAEQKGDGRRLRAQPLFCMDVRYSPPVHTLAKQVRGSTLCAAQLFKQATVQVPFDCSQSRPLTRDPQWAYTLLLALGCCVRAWVGARQPRPAAAQPTPTLCRLFWLFQQLHDVWKFSTKKFFQPKIFCWKRQKNDGQQELTRHTRRKVGKGFYCTAPDAPEDLQNMLKFACK